MMKRSRRRVGSAVFLACSLLASPSWSYSPLPFVVAQKGASAGVLVRAQSPPGQPVRLIVLRTVFGHVSRDTFIIEHRGWFSGSKLVDQHLYLVLLTPEQEPYRGDLTADGIPIYSCGVVNTLEVVNDQVLESDLYDVKYVKHRVPVALSEIERVLRQAHVVEQGV